MTPLSVYLPFNIDCLRGEFAPAKRGGGPPAGVGRWLVVQDQKLLVARDGDEAIAVSAARGNRPDRRERPIARRVEARPRGDMRVPRALDVHAAIGPEPHWHAGGANRTDSSRRAILAHYARADQPQRLNQKQAISPEVQALLSPLERDVLGLDN